LVAFAAAVAGTGGERPYLSGVKSIDPLAAKALRHIVRRLREMVRHYDARTLGDTTPTTGGRTEGYDNVTLPIARMLTRAQTAAIPQTPSEEKGFRKSLQPGGRRARSGQFAPLIIDRTVGTDAVVKYAHARRVKGSATGMTLRYPGRLLTDNARRAFARRTRARGGVVLIDQSGSMDVGPDELEELWRRCPDAWILGYSHTPGDTTGLPNAWVLAQPGSMTIHPRTGNVGNGVDGPALLWAARLAAAAPIVWVTDGQVTDANDHPDATLTMDCATLVRRERVRVVKNLNEVARALRLDPGRNPLRMREFGRLGRALASENLP
jgi:hypothetical protein